MIFQPFFFNVLYIPADQLARGIVFQLLHNFNFIRPGVTGESGLADPQNIGPRQPLDGGHHAEACLLYTSRCV